ncbi:NUDIX hydrolase domain-like protein [Mycena capillaripes]|nr:NUDIX hydrolase domain-like protein [Mycena capillaripes]
MASSAYPSTQYFSSQFVVSAGCILFRRGEESGLEICVLHDRNKHEWVLPKGRKDCGESIETAAVRETFEETGYACTLLPVRMPTRAPRPGINGIDAVAVVEDVTEPIAVVVRDQGVRGIKMVWWYIARCAPGIERVLGTQTSWEAFDAHWVSADVAAARLTYLSDQETVSRALEIVRDGNEGGV